VATELTELYEPLAEDKEISFAIDVPEDVTVHGDPNLLAQAIGNLVENAIKYTPCHGGVALRIGTDDRDRIEISVTDNGPGIPDADKPRATERFYRGDRGADQEGIGLGLSVVEAIARLHGGNLAMTDNPTGGLVATITLPRVVGASKAEVDPVV